MPTPRLRISGSLVALALAAAAPPASAEPARPALPVIPAGSVRVTDHGAIPDDGRDDTAAIQASIDANVARGGRTVLFPPGRYDVSVRRRGGIVLALTGKLRLAPSGAAGSAVVRLADGQPPFDAIMAGEAFATDLSDLAIEGMAFDANGTGNPVTERADTLTFSRHVLRVFVGRRVLVGGSTFLNADDSNVLSLNGTGVSDVTVRGSTFAGTGSARRDHDHSTIYSNNVRGRIEGNRFSSRNGPGTLAARAAIELHGRDQAAVGNVIEGMQNGIFVVPDATGGERFLVARNRVTGALGGVTLWPYADAPGDPSLAEVEIRDNRITLDADGWRYGPRVSFVRGQMPYGIGNVTTLHGAVADLTVADNRITFTNQARTARDRDVAGVAYLGSGIFLSRYQQPEVPVTDVSITGNVIVEPLAAGFWSDATLGGTAAPSRLDRNTVVDPGRYALYPAAFKQARVGLHIAGTAARIAIDRTTVRSTPGRPGPAPWAGVYAPAPCAGGCSIGRVTVGGAVARPVVAGPGWRVGGGG